MVTLIDINRQLEELETLKNRRSSSPDQSQDMDLGILISQKDAALKLKADAQEFLKQTNEDLKQWVRDCYDKELMSDQLSRFIVKANRGDIQAIGKFYEFVQEFRSLDSLNCRYELIKKFKTSLHSPSVAEKIDDALQRRFSKVATAVGALSFGAGFALLLACVLGAAIALTPPGAALIYMTLIFGGLLFLSVGTGRLLLPNEPNLQFELYKTTENLEKIVIAEINKKSKLNTGNGFFNKVTQFFQDKIPACVSRVGT